MTTQLESDEHEQTLVAVLVFGFAILGGLVKLVFGQGRLTQKVDDVAARVERLERLADGSEAPARRQRPPKSPG